MKTSKGKVGRTPLREGNFLSWRSEVCYSIEIHAQETIILLLIFFWSLWGYFSYFVTNQSTYIRNRGLLYSQQRALDTAQGQFRMLKFN